MAIIALAFIIIVALIPVAFAHFARIAQALHEALAEDWGIEP